MNKICSNCSAKKWADEPNGICCASEVNKSFENYANKGSTGRVRRVWLCRATRAPEPPPAALLAPRTQRRPALAARTGPLTPHHATHLTLVD
ncbi:unnamed protein product [Parnassius apollo]|uniref:(apollo) hypothetical protein n=1 Tax=Parnassius apollo TaxID=110799 RepID=A0A8S3XI12_PARAO|nr:unnamed protein product [Parnassius apollo]